MQIKLEKSQNVVQISDTDKTKEKTFTDFYEKNINWMDDAVITNPLVTLISFYPTYFKNDNPDYEKIREDILRPHKKRADNKAHEVFKCLFKLPYKNTTTVRSSDLDLIEREFGSQIMAHGVEEAKGGMYNLLLMCISNQVRVPSAYWGAFIKGMPNISPVSHGPYYLIYSMPSVNQSSYPDDKPKLSAVARILVPFPENKEILLDQLEAMVKVNLITPELQKMFMDKLVTYKEFLGELRAQLKVEKAPEASTTAHSFFSPTEANKENEEQCGLTFRQ